MLRESFSVHPQTTGQVTIRLSRPVPRSELIPLLEMLLRQNGQVMVREEGLYKIMPANLGTRGSVTPQVATTPAQLPNGYSVQIVQLKFAGVRDMARILEPYAVEPQSSIRVDELRNLLILSGTQRELKHMMEVIGLFDVDYLSGYSVGLFPMQTDVKSLSADLDRIFGSSTSGPVAPGPAGAGAAAAASANPLAGIVRIVPIERLNGLLVITTQPRYLEEARKWIDRLDKGGGLSGGMRLNVYPVQNGRADRLAQLLSDVYGNRTGPTGTAPGPTLAPGARPATTTPQQAQAGAAGAGQMYRDVRCLWKCWWQKSHSPTS
jgi:general secretion pathway protein D